MSLNIRAIYADIAALSITDVKRILDVTDNPAALTDRDLPAIIPDPGNLQSGLTPGMATFNSGMWTVESTLNYLYIHASVGAGRGLQDQFPAMLTNKDAIFTALAGMNTDADYDIVNFGIPNMNGVTDAAGTQYIGFPLTVTVRERINP